MGNLLKADLFRVIRTKIVYISLIVAVGLPLFMASVFLLTGAADLEGIEMAKLVYGNMLFTGTFSSILSFSYIFAIFPVIVIMMDFGNGTIRNKIIHGYTRHQIFAAHFIVSLLYVLVLTVLYAGTTTACSFLILKVGEFDVASVVYYFIIGLVGALISASIGCSMALSFANAGSILLTVVGRLLFDNLYLIVALIFNSNGMENNQVTQHVLSFFPCYVTGLLSSTIIEPVMVIEALCGILILSGGFYALGTFVFNKKDFK